MITKQPSSFPNICARNWRMYDWEMPRILFVVLLSSCKPTSDQETGLACRYTNPFSSSDECKSYVGSGWDETSSENNCAEVFPGVELSGDFSTVACEQEGSLGSCITDVGTEFEAATWFYSGEPAAAEAACANFAGGEWHPNDEHEDPEPSGELMDEARAALQSDEKVTVTPSDCAAYDADYECVKQMVVDNEFFAFIPVGLTPTTGLIIYPGGMVDPRAYAPQARAMAESGYLVTIVPMPDLFALNGVDRAQLVADAYPDISRWIIGGHSLGGTIAGQYAYEIGGVIGLFIWGSYISSEYPLSHIDLPVVTVFGSEEAIATDPKFEAAKPYLPSDAQYVEIEGGIHAQFGYYGNPKGEVPLIDHASQLALTIEAMRPLIEKAIAKADTRETRYMQATDLDSDICNNVQRTLTGMDESLLPASQLNTVWYDVGSLFSSAKATIDAAAEPQLTLRGYLEPSPDAGRWAPDSLGLDARCKMRRYDRIEAALGIDLPGTEGTCGEVNAMTLDAAKALLSPEEQSRYDTKGVTLQFADDIVAEVGGNWLPQNPVMELSSDGSTCRLSAPALEIEFPDGSVGDPEDLVGVHYCKLLSHSAALYWLTVQAFQEDGCVYPETDELCPHLENTPAASCIFDFSVASMHFCQDYLGPAWTVETAEAECADREESVFSTLACADRGAETSLLDGDGEFKGTCLLTCDDNFRTWNAYAEADGVDIAQFCSPWIPADSRGSEAMK